MHERVAPDLALAVVFHRHPPHGWECGMLIDATTQTFFCGDLLTQGGRGEVALTQQDILGPSEGFRQAMDYYAHAPKTLACMHGSAWQGDGAALLRQLAQALGAR